MARVLVLGASKGIGLETVNAALAARHRVRAFARSAAPMSLSGQNLERFTGDALNAGDAGWSACTLGCLRRGRASAYLAVTFGTLILFRINIYARIDQDSPHHQSYHFYALDQINALVLAKLMLLAEAAKLGAHPTGQRLQRGLLVYAFLLAEG